MAADSYKLKFRESIGKYVNGKPCKNGQATRNKKIQENKKNNKTKIK